MQFGGIAVGFAEFWEVNIVIFMKYSLDDFVCANVLIELTMIIDSGVKVGCS